MFIDFKREVYDEEDLKKYILENDIDLTEYRSAVIALITDKKGKILLQRRGPKSRDERFKLEDIGGSVDKSDKSFIEALKREIFEEAGEKIIYTIDNFIGAFLIKKHDYRSNKDVNWLFLLYKCTYVSGELKIVEPDKCLGYEFYKYDDFPKNEVTTTSLKFWDYYFKNCCYSYVMGIGEKINKLDNRFIVDNYAEDYTVTFFNKDREDWEKFITDNLEVLYWNEYINGREIVFIFKNTNDNIERYVLNKDNNQKLLEKCSLFAEFKFKSVKDMILSNLFYKDKIGLITFYD